MTQTQSKSRQHAEIAFSNIQTQFFAKNDAVNEADSMVQARAEKTVRLKEARLAKERADRMSAMTSLVAKRAKAR